MTDTELAKVDELARQLNNVISQIIWGHHPPMVYQLLTGIAAIENALPLLEGYTNPYFPRFTKEHLDSMREQIDKLVKEQGNGKQATASQA